MDLSGAFVVEHFGCDDGAGEDPLAQVELFTGRDHRTAAGDGLMGSEQAKPNQECDGDRKLQHSASGSPSDFDMECVGVMRWMLVAGCVPRQPQPSVDGRTLG